MLPTISDDRPIYLQIKEYLEEEILKGALTDDDQIPSTNELASFFGINPITVLKGVTMLTDENIIYKKRGIGMFVSPGACKKIQEHYRSIFVAETIEPLVLRAKALQFSQEELQQSIEEAWGASAKVSGSDGDHFAEHKSAGNGRDESND